jgi:hypothetical protein
MDVGEVLELLGEREAACLAECDRLQAEADRVGGLLAVCRSELERLVIARAVVGELAMAPSRSGTSALAAVNGVGGVVAGQVQVFTDRVLAVLAEQGRAVRCHEVVAALGEDATVARHVERVRHRLKKLRQAGQVEETAAGLFTLPRARGPAKG